jgi:hypothetical protein
MQVKECNNRRKKQPQAIEIVLAEIGHHTIA